MAKKFTKRSGVVVLLMTIEPQNISHLGEELVKVTQFQFFLFILALEIIFILIKSNPEIEGMTIFDYNHLYSAYADRVFS